MLYEVITSRVRRPTAGAAGRILHRAAVHGGLYAICTTGYVTGDPTGAGAGQRLAGAGKPAPGYPWITASAHRGRAQPVRITSYNVCYTKLLRSRLMMQITCSCKRKIHAMSA